MTQLSSSEAASGLLRLALARFKDERITPIRLVTAGEVSFVTGWSLMWASALDFVPRMPSAVWLSLMIVGLLLAGAERMRKPPP